MQGFIYGDRASMAGRWKFWIGARKRSWVGVRGGPGSETEGGARWEDKGTDKLTAGCSDDLPEGVYHSHGPIFSIIKAVFPRLGTSFSLTSTFRQNECFFQFSTHAHARLCLPLQWSGRHSAVVASGRPGGGRGWNWVNVDPQTES